MKDKLALLPLFLTLALLAFWLGTNLSGRDSARTVLVAGSEEKFEYLSSKNSNQCGLVAQNIDAFSEKESLQGACCGAMDMHRYQEQVSGLKKYFQYSDVVPEDPYDIPVALAKKLVDYQKSIQLTSEEQGVYDEAMKMSHEGGPCCCRCWRWTAFEGQAKYLITEKNFTSEQIAEVWDLEDGCGGSGHATDHG